MKKTPVQITPQLINDISNRNILNQKLRDLRIMQEGCKEDIKGVLAALDLLERQIAKQTK